MSINKYSSNLFTSKNLNIYIALLMQKSVLMFTRIKQPIIIGLAILISVLVNLPRILQLFGIIDDFGKTFNLVSVIDVLIRVFILFIFSWLILQFNSNWKYNYITYNKISNVLITIGINIFLFFGTVLFFIYFYQLFTGELLLRADLLILYFVYFVILLILIFLSRILRYQIIRQEDIAEKELLKRQSLQNELSALKNQINPHFLFNSLNTLNSLIRDNSNATTFVNKLSFMYRYILQSGQHDLVSLKEELKFLHSYIYLIKTRYRDRFKIQINIDDIYLNKKIPTLTLQLLVENAVKHNEISETNPLTVKVYADNDFLYVENAIKTRTTFVDSTGKGLVNIDKRYMFLKNKHISITKLNANFIVKLPLD